MFSVENQYNQPNNNLEGWFNQKPTIEMLLKHFNVQMDDSERIAKIAQLWAGQEVRLSNADYRIEEVGQGFLKQ